MADEVLKPLEKKTGDCGAALSTNVWETLIDEEESASLSE
jgi:hypothetical protein